MKKAELYPLKKNNTPKFSSPSALRLLAATPFAKTPVEAVLFHAEMLFLESGMTEPPFSPTVYAPLRSIKKVLYNDMKIDGRLIPHHDGFIIELRKDRPAERINFTFAHELSHTFFFEAASSVKYRTNTSYSQLHDEGEERLCDIAAAELLMPSQVISKIAKDYAPSPQALIEIAGIFETSLTATVVRLLDLGIWDSSFILWNCEKTKIEAKWIARPLFHLLRSPRLAFYDFERTSVYETYLTGETLTGSEKFRSNGVFVAGRFQSMKLNSSTVLSCFSNNSLSSNYSRASKSQPNLPLDGQCKCNGDGWLFIEKNGSSGVMPCRASVHRNPT